MPSMPPMPLKTRRRRPSTSNAALIRRLRLALARQINDLLGAAPAAEPDPAPAEPGPSRRRRQRLARRQAEIYPRTLRP